MDAAISDERPRFDPAVIVQRVNSQVRRPPLTFVERCLGGAVGAARVIDASGRSFVMTTTGGDTASRERHRRSLVVLEQLWYLDFPAPRYEAVIDLGHLIVVLQEVASGVPPGRFTEGLCDHFLALLELRRGIGEPFESGRLPLYLTTEGPSFARRSALAAHSPRTRALLHWIEEVGATYGGELVGSDAVHYDYHLGNVLVDPEDPDRITAIVDWDGACFGPIGFDLATLAFVQGPGTTEEAVTRRLARLTEGLPEEVAIPSWAHLSLRLVDWAVRFKPREVDYWLDRAEQGPLGAMGSGAFAM